MPDEAPVTSATSFLSFIGLPSRTWSVIIVRSSYDEHHILMQKKAPDTAGADRLRCPLGPSASETLRAGPWRAWGHRQIGKRRVGKECRSRGSPCADEKEA